MQLPPEVKRYADSLLDLKFNSKPIINSLTQIAQENMRFCKEIAYVIEERIRQAPPNEKLPSLYLLDSIVKNIGGEYQTEFSKRLVQTFCQALETVQEPDTRMQYMKLLKTWPQYFPPEKISLIEGRLKASAPDLLQAANNLRSIHVNPNLFQKRSGSSGGSTSSSSSTVQHQQQKQPQMHQIPPHQPPAPPVFKPAPPPQPQLIPGGYPPQPPATGIFGAAVATAPPVQHHHHLHIPAHVVPPAMGVYPPAIAAAPLVPPQVVVPPPAPPIVVDPFTAFIQQQTVNAGGSVNPTAQDTSSADLTLLNTLQRLLQSAPVAEPPAMLQPSIPIVAAPAIPVVLQELTPLEKNKELGIHSLYKSVQCKCSNCGLRFATQEELDSHMDRHYQMQMQKSKHKVLSRKWYQPADEWLERVNENVVENPGTIFFSQQKAAEQQEAANLQIQTQSTQKMQLLSQIDPVDSIVASDHSDLEQCPVCHEPFKPTYNASHDEWILTNAVKHPSTGQIVHRSCVLIQQSPIPARVRERETAFPPLPQINLDSFSDQQPDAKKRKME